MRETSPGWLWGGRWGLRSRQGVLLELPGHSLLPFPPLHGTAKDRGLSPFAVLKPFGSTGTSQGKQLLLLSSPQPAAQHNHGQRDSVELPHLPGSSQGRHLRAALPAPVLRGLHPALG